jgi:hypothetical protein
VLSRYRLSLSGFSEVRQNQYVPLRDLWQRSDEVTATGFAIEGGGPPVLIARRADCRASLSSRNPCCSGHPILPAMSELGRLSRAPHGLSAARNCTRDEGGLFEFGDQEPISGHRKPLRAKAVVVRVAGNAGTRFRQARSREASASEPLQKCRKRIRRCQNRGTTLPPRSARGMP